LNAQYNYDYIFSASNILVGDEAHNLTADVLKALNERYSGKKE
jgi:outer membrane protein